jgi:hypothetical protein
MIGKKPAQPAQPATPKATPTQPKATEPAPKQTTPTPKQTEPAPKQTTPKTAPANPKPMMMAPQEPRLAPWEAVYKANPNASIQALAGQILAGRPVMGVAMDVLELVEFVTKRRRFDAAFAALSSAVLSGSIFRDASDNELASALMAPSSNLSRIRAPEIDRFGYVLKHSMAHMGRHIRRDISGPWVDRMQNAQNNLSARGKTSVDRRFFDILFGDGDWDVSELEVLLDYLRWEYRGDEPQIKYHRTENYNEEADLSAPKEGQRRRGHPDDQAAALHAVLVRRENRVYIAYLNLRRFAADELRKGCPKTGDATCRASWNQGLLAVLDDHLDAKRKSGAETWFLGPVDSSDLTPTRADAGGVWGKIKGWFTPRRTDAHDFDAALSDDAYTMLDEATGCIGVTSDDALDLLPTSCGCALTPTRADSPSSKASTASGLTVASLSETDQRTVDRLRQIRAQAKDLALRCMGGSLEACAELPKLARLLASDPDVKLLGAQDPAAVALAVIKDEDGDKAQSLYEMATGWAQGLYDQLVAGWEVTERELEAKVGALQGWLSSWLAWLDPRTWWDKAKNAITPTSADAEGEGWSTAQIALVSAVVVAVAGIAGAAYVAPSAFMVPKEFIGRYFAFQESVLQAIADKFEEIAALFFPARAAVSGALR